MQALAPHRQWIAAFADTGGLRLSAGLGRLWDDQFPMILPPTQADGLGVAILNSNAETHFSFTNALGMVSVEQARRLAAVVSGFPHAHWIIALHHHLMEYPMSVAAFSERIGTALINGSWFVRKIKPFAPRAIVMHGHRHIDWIGACGKLQDHLGAVAGDGRGERSADLLSHSHFDNRPGRAGLFAAAGARGHRRCQHGRLNRITTSRLRPRFAPAHRADQRAIGWTDADRRTSEWRARSARR